MTLPKRTKFRHELQNEQKLGYDWNLYLPWGPSEFSGSASSSIGLDDVQRTGTGVHRLYLEEAAPYNVLLGFQASFLAATGSLVQNYSIVHKDHNLTSSTPFVDIQVMSNSLGVNTVKDLPASASLYANISFKTLLAK
jgi:hypothetical protein